MGKLFRFYEDDPQLQAILKDCENHEATYVKIDAADTPGPGMEYLTWGKPGTYVGYIRYMAVGNSLIVRGDYGDAIYMVTDNQPLRFWAGCGLSYMKEKCRASEGGYGSKWNDWSDSECIRCIEEAVEQHYDEEEDGPDEDALEAIERMKGAACTRQDYEMFLMRNEDDLSEIFGDYWMDYSMYDWGNVVPIRLKLHWAGLKLAMRQLKEKSDGR